MRRRAGRVRGGRREHRVADHRGAFYLARARPLAARFYVPAAYLFVGDEKRFFSFLLSKQIGGALIALFLKIYKDRIGNQYFHIML